MEISFSLSHLFPNGEMIAGENVLVNFPREAVPEDIPAESVFSLGLMYAPALFCLWMIMLGFISMYGIDRSQHHENLKTLGRK